MKVDIKVSIEIGGRTHYISYDDAKLLYYEMQELFDGKVDNANNKPNSRISGGIKSAIPVEDKNNESEKDIVSASMEDVDGVGEFIHEEVKVDTSLQNEMISKLKSHETEISGELEKLQERTKKMNEIIANYNK